MRTMAVVSVVALVGISLWQVQRAIFGHSTTSATNPTPSLAATASTPFETIDWQAPSSAKASEGKPASTAAQDKDGLSNIADNVMGALSVSLDALQTSGVYSTDNAQSLTEDLAATLQAKVSYTTFTAADFKTDADVSYKRMLTYRDDMRVALQPLLQNPGYELKLFSSYLDSKDATYLIQLKKAAANYQKAAENMRATSVPTDAISQHVAIANALSEFAAIVVGLSEHADDGFAGAALVRSYGIAEQNVFTSFNALAAYQKSKTP